MVIWSVRSVSNGLVLDVLDVEDVLDGSVPGVLLEVELDGSRSWAASAVSGSVLAGLVVELLASRAWSSVEEKDCELPLPPLW